ncbi:unnamed protein product [Malus baccata var. baccata]
MLRVSFFMCFLLIKLSLCVDKYNRDDFPPGFVFGASSSAYQVEDAADQDRMPPSILDTYAHAGNCDGATGDVACDQYHKYKAYRFSISWSRLMPNGRGPVNPKGVQYYNNLIDELINHGIQPHVTLHHSDLPQALDDEYGGWVSRKIVKDFTAYADACFKNFGDRVLQWTTINEHNVFILGAPFGVNCSRGNFSTEPYMAAHYTLLAHASADKQHGYIGINVFAYWFVPLTKTIEDELATQRAMDFYFGWVLNPLVFGDYPDVMKKIVGSRILVFTSLESRSVKGSFDFIGLNYYHALNIKDYSSTLKMETRDFMADLAIKISPPWGLQELLEYIKENYGSPPIYIHENGQRTRRNSSLEDWGRVKFLQGHIQSLLEARRNGSNSRGYLTWSFLDSLELLDGYESSYGLYYMELEDLDLKRQPKLSAHWYSHFLKRTNVINFDEGFTSISNGYDIQ